MTKRIKISWRNLSELLRLLLVLGVVAAVSWLFPRSHGFPYTFSEGQIWRYENLYAPFDFPIRKSAAELEKDRENLKGSVPPCYVYDPEVPRLQKHLFSQAFARLLDQYRADGTFEDVVRQSRRYEQYGLELLDRLYQNGIIALEPEHSAKGREFVLQIVQGNTTRKATAESFFTVSSAKDWITDSLPYSGLSMAEFFLPILPDAVIPNLYFNDSLTALFQQEQLEAMGTSRGMVRKNESIIRTGEVLTPEVFMTLTSLRETFKEQSGKATSFPVSFAGYFLLTLLAVGLFVLYLRSSARELYLRFNQLFFLLIWVVIYGYLVYAVERTEALSVYLIPFAIVPIIVRVFHGDKMAMLTHFLVILVASLISEHGLELFVLQALGGMVVIMSQSDGRDWSRFFLSLVYLYLVFALAYAGLSLSRGVDLTGPDRYFFVWIFLNVFLTLLAYPLIPLVERLFGFTSSISLMELSDLNKPLLRELALKAPGTLQHSLQVANLAEAAAHAVGGDTLLVRVGALYHDIGKTIHPEFFAENGGGEKSPHDGLDYEESARIIIEHVTVGEKLARKHKLPKPIIDFIRTHHGNTRVEYFYRFYLKDNPDQADKDHLFRYPGPKPRTREETILMLADSLEASARSLKNPSIRELDDLVTRIISYKHEQGQFQDSRLSFYELERCKTIFRRRLRSMYHGRIEYPE